MKTKSILGFFAALLMLPAFAGATQQLDQKYIFEDLQQVKRFNNWSIDSWNPIDSRSIIVRTSPSKAYLLILNRKLNGLKFNEGIAISSTGSSIYAKFDSVRVLDRHSINFPAHISRIYKLDGKEARKMVKQQILGKEKTTPSKTSSAPKKVV